MDKYEFKINYYFNMYKNEPLSNAKEFKMRFIKKHGNFQYLNEVVLRINRYQVKKYGNGLIRFSEFETDEQLQRKAKNSRHRYNQTKRRKNE